MNLEIPNYLTHGSELAEQEFDRLLEKAADLGVERLTAHQVFHTRNAFNAIENRDSDRLVLVASKLGIPIGKLALLNEEVFSDKVLGIDRYFRFNGKIIGADIATGKASSMVNKRNKMMGMRGVYEDLGIKHAIAIRMEQKTNDDLLLTLFSLMEAATKNPQTFYMEFRINKNEEFNEIYFLS